MIVRRPRGPGPGLGPRPGPRSAGGPAGDLWPGWRAQRAPGGLSV